MTPTKTSRDVNRRAGLRRAGPGDVLVLVTGISIVDMRL